MQISCRFGLALLLVACCCSILQANASILTASAYWRKAESNSIMFEMQFTAESAFFGKPTIGAEVLMGAIEIEHQGYPITDLPVRAVVHTIDTHNGWFASSATVPYTIPSIYTLPFDATFIRCCRSRDLAETNANSKMMLQMRVYYLALGSPVVSMSPPHYAALGSPFELVSQALGIQDTSLVTSTTTPLVSGLLVTTPCGNQNVNSNFNTCPIPMAVANGIYTWTPTRVGMYVLQVRVTESVPYNAISVVEHIIYVVPVPSVCPSCNYFPTLSPINLVNNLYIDKPFTLTVTADDLNVSDDLRLVTSALPANMIVTKISRTQHTISWRPSGNDYSTIVCFKVRDTANTYNTGASTCIAFVIYKWSSTRSICTSLGHPDCGPGKRTVTSSCKRHFPSPIDGLSTSETPCTALEPKPANSESCDLTPCYKYEYVSTDWGFCNPSGPCTGTGTALRSSQCQITATPGASPYTSTALVCAGQGLLLPSNSQVRFTECVYWLLFSCFFFTI